MQAQLVPVVYSTSTAENIIRSYAIHYGINGDELLATLKCESSLDSSSVGDHGTSFGVAQIHLSAHKNVTKAEALDPFFSIDWSARQFALGNANIWTCHRLLFSGNSA